MYKLPTKSVPDLFDLCMDVVTSCAWRLTNCDEMIVDALARPDQAYQAYLGGLPRYLADRVVGRMLRREIDSWVDNAKEGEEGGRGGLKNRIPPHLLPFLGIEPLTYLDLSGLKELGLVTFSAFDDFDQAFINALSRMPSLKHLNASTVSTTATVRRRDKRPDLYLPTISDSHLVVIGRSCKKLVYLDVSFNQGVTIVGLRSLVPGVETDTDGAALDRQVGCPDLEHLFVFECPLIFRDMARLSPQMKALTYLGYKEGGKMMRAIYQQATSSSPPTDLPHLHLTHLNNLGNKARKMAASGFRCRRPICEAIAAVNPGLLNIKIRVTDNDCAHLSLLESLKTVELVYTLGGAGGSSPGAMTESFLAVRGNQLTSVAIIGNNFNFRAIEMIAINCPNLNHLWFRANTFNPLTDGGITLQHAYLTKLTTLYFRVGLDNLSMANIGASVLPFLLFNAKCLKELMVAVRCPQLLTDEYLINLIVENSLSDLEKLLVLIPGKNDVPNILPLTLISLEFVLRFCPFMRKIGNLLTWHVSEEDLEAFEPHSHMANVHEVDIIRRNMTFR